jgi:hypothetical protein
MLTADTITDEQITAMHWRGEIDCFTRDMALVPYHEGRGSPREWMTQARARCAEILNARAKESK